MTIAIEIYRNPYGEVFFRTSRTGGRTRAFRVEAESPDRLEDWLESNGFRPPAPGGGFGTAAAAARDRGAHRLPVA